MLKEFFMVDYFKNLIKKWKWVIIVSMVLVAISSIYILVLGNKVKPLGDAYLAQHDAELKEVCGGPYQLSVNHTFPLKLSSKEYRSTFHYSYWLQCGSGKKYVIPVLLSNDSGEYKVVASHVVDVSKGITVAKEFN